MKKLMIVLALLLALTSSAVAGYFTYHLQQASPLQLIIYMDPERSSKLLRWSARQAFFLFPPTDKEIAELNAEAGARYAATFPRHEEAEALLSHLLGHGVDINSLDINSGSGLTALHSAALAADARAVAILLNSGADPHAKDSRGSTPLDLIHKAQANRPDRDFSEVIAILERAVAR